MSETGEPLSDNTDRQGEADMSHDDIVQDFDLGSVDEEACIPVSSSEAETSSSSSEEDTDSSISETDESIGSVDLDRFSDSDQSSASDDEDVVSSVYEGCALTVDEAVLQLMDLFVDQSLQKQTVGKFLKTLLQVLPEENSMPKTQHSLFNYVEKMCPLPQEKIHFYCKQFQFYLDDNHRQCEVCNSDQSCKFYQLSLSDQIKNLFENHNLADYIDEYSVERASKTMEGVYQDVCDGSEFQRTEIHGEYSLTLLGHTDGIAVTESGDALLWPMEYVILQVSPRFRFNFLLLNGVWLDTQKPMFNTFFGPYANELKTLYDEGVAWKHPKTNQMETSLVVCPGFCVDAPVRAQIQNILSHGGRHCCHTCEQKMVKLPAGPLLPGVKRKKRKRIFSYQEDASELRTAERMRSHGEITLQRKILANGGRFDVKKGVIGRSIVSKLPLCDRSCVVFPEYMHLLIGIIKQFLTLWFLSDKNLPYSLRDHRDVVG